MGNLILYRRQGEAILIGDNIKVTVVKGIGSTQLAITAPSNIKILREEIRERYSAPQHNIKATPADKT